MNRSPIQILLVEDDEVDREAVERAFREKQIASVITVARDGIIALEILRGSSERTALARPHLILLDLNLPRMDGLTFLGELRADPQLRDSIVFVLTTSRRDEDRIAAYGQGVAGYISKSAVGSECVTLVNLLKNYWCLVELPR